MTTPAIWANFKSKKRAHFESVAQRFWNHPHRLAAITLTGTLDYTLDERDFGTPPSYSASRYVFDLDFSAIAALARKLPDKTPWIFIPDPADVGEFVLYHEPRKMWEMLFSLGALPADVVIGTCTTTLYTRADPSDPWTTGSTTTTDIDGNLDLLIAGGGDGSLKGRGDGSDDEKAQITVFHPVTGGSESFRIPSIYAEILRLPWSDPWAAESSAFSTAFDDEIDARNTTDGGGHSGSTTATLTFA